MMIQLWFLHKQSLPGVSTNEQAENWHQTAVHADHEMQALVGFFSEAQQWQSFYKKWEFGICFAISLQMLRVS